MTVSCRMLEGALLSAAQHCNPYDDFDCARVHVPAPAVSSGGLSAAPDWHCTGYYGTHYGSGSAVCEHPHDTSNGR